MAITWGLQTIPVTANTRGVAWSPSLNLFVICASPLGNATQYLTSPDTSTWTARAGPTTKFQAIGGVAWSPTLALFVAVGQDTDGSAATAQYSADGINWTEGVTPDKTDYLSTQQGVRWVPTLGKFLSFGTKADFSGSWILSSVDGINWVEESQVGLFISGLAYSPELGLTLVVGQTSSPVDYGIATSPDLSVWTLQTASAPSSGLTGADWSSRLGLFIAGSWNDGVSQFGVMTSPDGVNWTSIINDPSYMQTISVDVFDTIDLVICTVGSIDSPAPFIGSADGLTWANSLFDGDNLNYSVAPFVGAVAFSPALLKLVSTGPNTTDSTKILVAPVSSGGEIFVLDVGVISCEEQTFLIMGLNFPLNPTVTITGPQGQTMANEILQASDTQITVRILDTIVQGEYCFKVE